MAMACSHDQQAWQFTQQVFSISEAAVRFDISDDRAFQLLASYRPKAVF